MPEPIVVNQTIYGGKTLNDLAARTHKTATEHGFWPEEGRNFGEMIALAHSELSEALEEHRSDRPALYDRHIPGCELADYSVYGLSGRPGGPPPCTCTPKPEGTAVELADCIIRVLDTMHSLGVDIDEVMERKMRYNESRPYKHGRQY